MALSPKFWDSVTQSSIAASGLYGAYAFAIEFGASASLSGVLAGACGVIVGGIVGVLLGALVAPFVVMVVSIAVDIIHGLAVDLIHGLSSMVGFTNN